MNDQTIFRAHRKSNYLTVSNETVRDPNLTFRATGLLMVLLSYPDNWKANQQHIATCKKEGRDAVITAWGELREAGYLEKEVIRNQGRVVTVIWHVHEVSINQNPEKPETVEPEKAQPETAEPTLRKTKGNKRPKETKRAPALVVFPKSLDTPEFKLAWDEWTAFRRSRKYPAYQDFSIRKLFEELEKFTPLECIRAINKSIANQWRSLNPQNEKNPAQTHRNGSTSRNAGTFHEGKHMQYAGIQRLVAPETEPEPTEA